MDTPRISRGRQLRFLAALRKSGNVLSAASDAHVDRASIEEARRTDREFAREWEAAEKAVTSQLEYEAWRRAMEGVPEPIISEGKILRDDAGQPLSIQRYSDALLIELLRKNRTGKSYDGRFWKAPLGSRLIRRLSFFLLTLAVLAISGLAAQWLQNHLFIAAFH